jgi:hypothetical protein
VQIVQDRLLSKATTNIHRSIFRFKLYPFLFSNRISPQCPKSIKSKYFIFTLVGKDQNDIEIFGANNAAEREARENNNSTWILI